MTHITEYKDMVQVITTDKAAGEQLAILAASFSNDPGAETSTFDSAVRLSPQAWAIEFPAKPAFSAAIDALIEGVSVDDPRLAYLVERGMTTSLWGQAKQIIKASRYTIWQQDGSYTPNTEALSQLILANNYTPVS